MRRSSVEVASARAHAAPSGPDMPRRLILLASLASPDGLQARRRPAPYEYRRGTTGTGASEIELIPRDALFGSAERANVQTSPDGEYLSWPTPVDGVLNVWIAPADDVTKAVTDHKARHPPVFLELFARHVAVPARQRRRR